MLLQPHRHYLYCHLGSSSVIILISIVIVVFFVIIIGTAVCGS
jgi:hypothetical protein